MDIVDNHINVHVNNIKNYFVEYKQFILIFTLVTAAIFSNFYSFPHYKKYIFLFSNIIEDYSPEWKTKKQKQKIITEAIKKTSERFQEYFSNLSEDEKIKEINYANNRNKNMSDEDKERKKEYMRN